MGLDEPGYLQATVGGLIGLLVSGLLGCSVGFVYFSYQLRDDPYGLPGLGAIIVAVPAALLGQAIGCWMALRLAEFKGASATAGIVAVMNALLLVIIIRAIASDQDVEGMLYLSALLVLVQPAFARALVIKLMSWGPAGR